MAYDFTILSEVGSSRQSYYSFYQSVNTTELDDNMLRYLIEMRYIVEVLNKPISLRVLTDKIDQIMIATTI
jgi:hypothetical protein